MGGRESVWVGVTSERSTQSLPATLDNLSWSFPRSVPARVSSAGSGYVGNDRANRFPLLSNALFGPQLDALRGLAGPPPYPRRARSDALPYLQRAGLTLSDSHQFKSPFFPQSLFNRDLTPDPTAIDRTSDHQRVSGFNGDHGINPDITRFHSDSNGLERARGPSRSTSFDQGLTFPNLIQLAQSDVPGSPGMMAPALRAAVASGSITEEEAAVLQQRANALGAEKDARLQAAISAGLPKYDGKTSYGVLITNEGNVVQFQSARPGSFRNYPAAKHVEGKAAIWIRENGSTGGVLYHNNRDGTCGFCNAHLRTLLPQGARLRVVPPRDAIAKDAWARPGPTDYEGNAVVPKSPLIRQPDLFGNQP
jgi:hypothetical protein